MVLQEDVVNLLAPDDTGDAQASVPTHEPPGSTLESSDQESRGSGDSSSSNSESDSDDTDDEECPSSELAFSTLEWVTSTTPDAKLHRAHEDDPEQAACQKSAFIHAMGGVGLTSARKFMKLWCMRCARDVYELEQARVSVAPEPSPSVAIQDSII